MTTRRSSPSIADSGLASALARSSRPKPRGTPAAEAAVTVTDDAEGPRPGHGAALRSADRCPRGRAWIASRRRREPRHVRPAERRRGAPLLHRGRRRGEDRRSLEPAGAPGVPAQQLPARGRGGLIAVGVRLRATIPWAVQALRNPTMRAGFGVDAFLVSLRNVLQSPGQFEGAGLPGSGGDARHHLSRPRVRALSRRAARRRNCARASC